MTFCIIPKGYNATTQILVTQAKESNDVVQSSEIQANIQMVNTYSVILKSKQLLKDVAKEYPTYSANSLLKKITVASDSNSQVIDVTVTDGNPTTAVNLANSLGDQFIRSTSKMIKTNHASILSRADLEDSKLPASPNHMIHLSLGLLIGLFLSFLVIVLREVLDSTIKTEVDIETSLGLPILGIINHVEKGGTNS